MTKQPKRSNPTSNSSLRKRLEGRLFDLELNNENLEIENEHLKQKPKENQELIRDVDRYTQYALQKNINLEQYTRKSSARIYGLNVNKVEEIAETIQQLNNLLKNKLQIDI